jgi:tetratricopeptide (TPR) repeat protein
VSEEEILAENYLKSLTAPEELAVFLSLRGNCLKEAGRIPEAITSYAQAARLAPNVRGYRLLLAAAEKTLASKAPPQQVSLPMQGGGGVLQQVNRSSISQTRFGPDPSPLLKTH